MRAQGSLEYLIIIAAVLVVSSVVVMFVTGAVGGQKSTASLSLCKQASVDCKASKMLSPNDPCTKCDKACKDSTSGKEVFDGAAFCCASAQTDMIYDGSLGCGGGYLPTCGNNRIDIAEECDGYMNQACPDACTNICTCTPYIVAITNPSVSSGSSVTLTATTTRNASCSYSSSTAPTVYTAMTTTDRKQHTASLTSLTAGSKTYSVNCTSQVGGLTGTKSVTWTVDLTPPTVSFSSPTSNANYRTGATVPIAISASDSVSAINSVNLIIKQTDTGAQIVNTALSSPYSYTWDPNTCPNCISGSFNITANVTDKAGNYKEASVNISYDLLVELFYDEFLNLANWQGDINCGTIYDKQWCGGWTYPDMILTGNNYWTQVSPANGTTFATTQCPYMTPPPNHGTELKIEHSQDPSGYRQVNVSFYAAWVGMWQGMPQHFIVEWFDGTNWQTGFQGFDTTWYTLSGPISFKAPTWNAGAAGAGGYYNTNFKIRLNCNYGPCAIDTLRIIGWK